MTVKIQNRTIQLIGRIAVLSLVGLTTACTFNFEVTTQRTALENQVMGSYKELEDDLVLMSAVRAPKAGVAVSQNRQRALDARQNQDFNRDDLDELKSKGVVGETNDGTIVVVSKGGGSAAGGIDPALVATIVDEENRDREVIWRRIIESNQNLSAKDLPDVRKTYAKMQREAAQPGHWYQDETGAWVQRPGASQ